MIRRTQAERSDETTGRLVRAARELFGAHGYALTSIDAMAAAAGVTKGAAYHHFNGKVALFRAAFVGEQEEVAAAVERAALSEPDPWAALRRGCRTFLERCLDPGFRQIVLLDAPSVLGWETVREIEYAHTLRVLLAGLDLATAEGDKVVLSMRAQLVFGALCEGGMLLARSADPAADLPRLAAEADRFLAALRP
ncbi:TetR/AcrR family transcriptional regulator [Nonomuraea angiospora]|uniref:TetR/AcrR family transcriptional regulator n=1 Tax=Nonomuraea angiospora TaxID=46172 RepID=UPI0029A3C37B|nr:helix-turn-helix domain-containing protein [Nonomuraea angiospora]MDX3108024.1 helix-turn-helix domain containing protein [Nonomuraea angiospora]